MMDDDYQTDHPPDQLDNKQALLVQLPAPLDRKNSYLSICPCSTYVCAVCHFETRIFTTIKLHGVQVHRKQQRYKCGQCHYECTKPKEIQCHMKPIQDSSPKIPAKRSKLYSDPPHPEPSKSTHMQNPRDHFDVPGSDPKPYSQTNDSEVNT